MKFIYLLFVPVFFIPFLFAKPAPNKEVRSESKTLASLKEEKSCQKKGESFLSSKDYEFTNPFNFSSQTNEWVNQSISHVIKNQSDKCLSPCKQINNYEVRAKIYPQKVRKSSCKGPESKESYVFNKKFSFKNKKRSSLKLAHKNMTQWIVSTFVNPYYPVPFLELSEESLKNNIGKACPSCSFYFEYSYKYKARGHLDLDIKARCGDQKVFLSPFKMEFQLFNYWECKRNL